MPSVAVLMDRPTSCYLSGGSGAFILRRRHRLTDHPAPSIRNLLQQINIRSCYCCYYCQHMQHQTHHYRLCRPWRKGPSFPPSLPSFLSLPFLPPSYQSVTSSSQHSRSRKPGISELSVPFPGTVAGLLNDLPNSLFHSAL